MRIELKYPDIPLYSTDELLAEQNYTMTRIPKLKQEIKSHKDVLAKLGSTSGASHLYRLREITELTIVLDEQYDRLQQVKNELLKRQQHDNARRTNSRNPKGTKDASAGMADHPRNK